MNHKILPGSDLSTGCRQMFAKAELHGCEVTSEFNGIPLTTNGFANWEALASYAHQQLKALAAAHQAEEARKIGYSYDKLIAFARWLYQERNFDAEELLAMLEKPWNWQTEYDEWQDRTDAEKAGVS